MIATGPWTHRPARWLDTSIPLAPVKGELVLARATGGGVRCDFAWRDAAVYGAGNGEIWLGGTEDRAGFQFERIIRLDDFVSMIGELQPNPRLRRRG